MTKAAKKQKLCREHSFFDKDTPNGKRAGGLQNPRSPFLTFDPNQKLLPLFLFFDMMK